MPPEHRLLMRRMQHAPNWINPTVRSQVRNPR
jgi:hypothetical protein